LPFTFITKLNALGIETIEFTTEDNRWVVNGLAVRSRRVVMPEGLSSGTRAQLEERQVEIITVPYDKMQLNGGGVHCSTCPLERASV